MTDKRIKKKEDRIKPIGWNNICLSVPDDWEIDSLDTAHLLIGKDDIPCIELKWTEGPKRFALDKFLKKFIAKTQRLLNIIIHEQATPADFSHPAPHLNFFFFNWEGHGSKGTGAIVFCRECKRLTLIRFFKPSIVKPVYKQILSSFSDHPQSGRSFWHIFGMSFEAPGEYQLQDYSFKPGAFKVILAHKKNRLVFYNWGPASFLLSKTDLSGFAQRHLPQLTGFAKTGICKKGNFLEWACKQERFKNAQKLPFINRFSHFLLFRICNDAQNNRILGVEAASPHHFNHSLIQESILGDI